MSTTAYPTELTPEVVAALAAPFPLDLVEVKPGATGTSRDGQPRALILGYVAWRAYARRLDEVVGPANWSFKLIPWGPTRLIAELTILGVTKTASGEGDERDENCGTSAEAQAKKRACAEFCLGRYLYDLPNDLWWDYDPTKKRIVEPKAAAAELYRRAGLPVDMDRKPGVTPARRTAAEVQPATPRASVNPERQARARAALDQAEQRTGVTPRAPHPPAQPTAAPSTPAMASKAQVRELLQHGAEAVSLADGRFGKKRFYDLTEIEADTLIKQLNA